MALARALPGYLHSAACGITALGIHVGLVLALPDAPQPRAFPPVSAAPLWMEGIWGAAEAADEPGARSVAVAARAQRSRLKAGRRSAESQVDGMVPAQRSTAFARTPELASPTETSAHGAFPDAAPIVAEGEGLSGSGASPQADADANLSGRGDGAPTQVPALVRRPALLQLQNPCARFFPADAHTDVGEVKLDVEVDRGGYPHASTVLAEKPSTEGFARAARACAAHLRFTPAMDAEGVPIPGHATLKLRFARRSAT